MLDRQKDLMPYTPESHTTMGWAGLHSDLPPHLLHVAGDHLGDPLLLHPGLGRKPHACPMNSF